MHNMENQFGPWVIRHRWLIIVLTLLAVAAAANGLKYIHFTNDYRVFFAKENPQLQAFDALESTYTKNDNVLIVLAPKQGKVFTPKMLALVEQVTHQAWQTPFSIRVDSVSNFQHTRAEGDDLVVQDLVEQAMQLSAPQIQAIRTIALNEPSLVNRLVSADEQTLAINITVQMPGIDEMAESPQVVDFARDLAAQIRTQHPEVDVYLTGMVMLNGAFGEASQMDMQTLIPISFAAMIILLGLMLRSILPTLATLIVILFAIFSAMGLGGYLGYPLTSPSASAPTIILTVAIAGSVHILSTFLFGLRHGMDKKEAMIESLRVNLQPVFLTTLTTALGFLSLNFSESPPFRHLGNFVALGVGASFIFSVTFLPALMTLLPLRVRPSTPGRETAMSTLAEFVIEYRKPLLIALLGLTVLMMFMIPRNHINEVFVEYFDQRVPFRVDTDFANKHLATAYTIDYSLKAKQTGGISDPAFLQTVDAFATWWREQPETVQVNTITDVMKRLNKSMHGDDPAWYRLPASRELAAQYLLMYEMSLPYGLDLNNQLNIDKSATRLSASIRILSTTEVLALERRASDWLAQHAQTLTHPEGSSTVIMFSHIATRNFYSMMSGTLLALFLISVLLVVALRSFKIGLMSLIPNLAPAAMGFGLWGLLVSDMNLAVSIVVAVTLGIVVDDTVHFLSKYLRARREHDLNPQDAVRYAFTHVGHALWVTTLVLIVGFSILSMSNFLMNSTMGLMTAIVLAFALLLDFFLLPPLLILLEEKSHEKSIDRDTVIEPVRP